MHRKIDAAFGQRFFNLFGEHALGADLGERDVGDLVAGGLDDLDLDFVSALAQQVGNVVRLPERELRAARTNPQATPSASHLDFVIGRAVCSPAAAAFFTSRD